MMAPPLRAMGGAEERRAFEELCAMEERRAMEEDHCSFTETRKA